jgi:hypothetical protein
VPHPGDRVDFPFVGASAVVTIGLALTGTLQTRVSHSPITVLSQIDRR